MVIVSSLFMKMYMIKNRNSAVESSRLLERPSLLDSVLRGHSLVHLSFLAQLDVFSPFAAELIFVLLHPCSD